MLIKFEVTDFEDIYEILVSSFPRDERRDRAGQLKIFESPEYMVLGICEGELSECAASDKNPCAAIMALWDFGSFVYLEHFAVKENMRNGGIGKKMLKEMIESFGKPVVLEVEPPEDDLTKRRIAFYQRNGFALNHYDYIQLAYTEEENSIPLMIMSYPNSLSEKEFINVRNTIYRELFGVIVPEQLVLEGLEYI